MFIKLRKDYQGYFRGSVIEVGESEAKELIQKKIAVYASSQSSMSKKDIDFALRR